MQAYSISMLIFPDAPAGNHAGLCAICGTLDNGCWPRNDILDKTSANLTAIFDLNQDLVCRHCCAIWREPKKYHRAIYADTTQVLFPVISRESATDTRPVWSDLIAAGLNDGPRVMVLTTDPKKRVWPFARVSHGDTAVIYVHDPSRGVSGNVAVSVARLRQALAAIETAYVAGFPKPVIEASLWSSPRTVTQVGLPEARRLEAALINLRDTPEFIPALIAAQKGDQS